MTDSHGGGAARPRPGMLSMAQLQAAAGAGEIDTVTLAFTDMQGRLAGKRLSAEYFLDEVAEHYAEGCNYLLAVDVDMNTVGGYEMSSWERGYGDFVLKPDLTTHAPPAVASGHRAGARRPDLAGRGARGRLAAPDPAGPDRAAGRARLGRAGRHRAGVHRLPRQLRAGGRQGLRNLIPANQYNVDYSILGTSRIDPLLRRITSGMSGAGMYVESAKGECNFGQHEIAFRYSDAVTTCDNHSIYKTGAKEIAAQDGMALTFMAKPNLREGNSCHIHLSLREEQPGPGGKPG